MGKGNRRRELIVEKKKKTNRGQRRRRRRAKHGRTSEPEEEEEDTGWGVKTWKEMKTLSQRTLKRKLEVELYVDRSETLTHLALTRPPCLWIVISQLAA